VDTSEGVITLQNVETTNGDDRIVPILEGDMPDLLAAAKKERAAKWPNNQWVFNREGDPIRDFRWAWAEAC
jgi:hypothetical protein